MSETTSAPDGATGAPPPQSAAPGAAPGATPATPAATGPAVITGGDPAPASTPGADGGSSSWDAALDPAGRQLVQTKGWKTPADALKSYAELERLVGANKVALPGKDAKPEDWAKFYNSLGRPETPDKYDLSGFKPPEGLPWNGQAQTAMVGELHKLGLSQTQVQGALTAYAAVQGANWQAREAAAAKAPEQTTAALRQEWGAGYDTQMEHANRAVKAGFGQDLDAVKQIRLADGTYLLDNPAMAKALARLGAALSEDGGLPGARGSSGAGAVRTPAQANAEISRIRAEAASDPKHPYTNRQHPEFKAMQARMNELYALAAGGQ